MVSIRQRLLLIMVMITAAILAWEVYQLFFGEEASSTASSVASLTSTNNTTAPSVVTDAHLAKTTSAKPLAVASKTTVATKTVSKVTGDNGSQKVAQHSVDEHKVAVVAASATAPATPALAVAPVVNKTPSTPNPVVVSEAAKSSPEISNNTPMASLSNNTISSSNPMPDSKPNAAAAPVVAANAGISLPLVPPTVDTMATNLNVASASQAEYIAMVNAYQIAQLQRLLAEQRAAIAIAKRNAAEADAETAKYLSQTQSESSANANQNEASTDLSSGADTSAVENTLNYIVKYVDFRDQQWSALLEKGGKLLEVKTGETLSDGTKVMAIADDGVTLQQGTETNKLKFGES